MRVGGSGASSPSSSGRSSLIDIRYSVSDMSIISSDMISHSGLSLLLITNSAKKYDGGVVDRKIASLI